MAIKAYSYAKDGSKALSKNFHVPGVQSAKTAATQSLLMTSLWLYCKKSGITSARL